MPSQRPLMPSLGWKSFLAFLVFPLLWAASTICLLPLAAGLTMVSCAETGLTLHGTLCRSVLSRLGVLDDQARVAGSGWCAETPARREPAIGAASCSCTTGGKRSADRHPADPRNSQRRTGLQRLQAARHEPHRYQDVRVSVVSDGVKDFKGTRLLLAIPVLSCGLSERDRLQRLLSWHPAWQPHVISQLASFFRTQTPGFPIFLIASGS